MIKRKVLCLYTLLNPAIPTRKFPTVLAPHIPRFLYKMSHKCVDKVFWFALRNSVIGFAKMNGTCQN